MHDALFNDELAWVVDDPSTSQRGAGLGGLHACAARDLLSFRGRLSSLIVADAAGRRGTFVTGISYREPNAVESD